MKIKLFAGILIILIVAILSFFILMNKNPEEVKIRNSEDLNKSYIEFKEKDFINALYINSDKRTSLSSYSLYIKNKNNFTLISDYTSNVCSGEINLTRYNVFKIEEDSFFASVHAFQYYYSFMSELEKPQIIDYSNLFLSFSCFNTKYTKNDGTGTDGTYNDIICFNQPSGVITKFNRTFNSTDSGIVRLFNTSEFGFSKDLLYASFKEETPENIIKNNNPCNLTAIVEKY